MMVMIDDNAMHQVISTAIGPQFLNISIFYLDKSAADLATAVCVCSKRKQVIEDGSQETMAKKLLFMFVSENSNN